VPFLFLFLDFQLSILLYISKKYKQMIKHLILFLAIVLSLLSCKDETSTPYTLEQSFKYFPLTPGFERVYQVTSIKLDVLSGINDTSVYYIKETVTDTIIDTLDYKMYAIAREIKTEDEPYWKEYDQIGIRKHNRSLVRVENNIPVDILEFPERINKEWDGNAFNSLEEEMFEITQTLTHDTVISGELDSVLIVLQDYNSNVYTLTHKEERYAYNVGLCSATYINAESQPNDAPIQITDPIETRLTKGTLVYYNLMSYSIPK